MTTRAPAPACRRRLLPAAAVLLAALPAHATPAGPAADCAAPGTGWCVARRFAGDVRGGELGFRFGEPLDADGDGRADVAAGARFELWRGTQQNGSATVWSGATGAAIRAWDGEWPDALFGHWVLPVPDLSGDGLADVVVAAPHARVDGRVRGLVVARSPKTGAELWRRVEREGENLGWDLALAGDQDGDGRPDLFAGAPAHDGGRVRLLAGRDGAVLRTYAPRTDGGSFGWYVARLDDLDGDGRADLAVGGPSAGGTGAVWILSAARGAELHRWTGTDPRGGFGGVVAAVADADGDGKGDVAVAAPGTEDPARTLPGEVQIRSSATGAVLRRFTGTQPGELYGRMVVATGDLDGDGVDDVAVGAPWHRRGDADRVGRLELRSGRSGDLLAELAGAAADSWFGWHVRRAPDPDGRGRPALLVSALRRAAGTTLGAGALDLVVLRPDGARDQGTITRDARRSDIR